MNGKNNEACRACLSYFNVNDEKYSLLNCSAVKAGTSRLEIMKNVLNTFSLTLLPNEQNEEVSEVFICTSCVEEVNIMLTFLEKCIRTEAILKKAARIKTESNAVWTNDEGDNLFHPKVEIKEEGLNKDSFQPEFDSDDIPLSLYTKTLKNNEESKHECLECHKKFHSTLTLAFHKYKHMDYKSHTCFICSETFRTSQLIKIHMATEHENACFQPYSNKYHHMLHESRKHNSKTYSCHNCKKTFSTVSSLKLHGSVHQTCSFSPVSCTLCSQSFATDLLLKKHKKNLHTKIKKFDCHCGQSFNRKKKLEFHIDSVHEKKEKLTKYSCLECDKKFYHPYALKNHVNVHLGVKPFLCNVCGSAFTLLSNLTTHFRRVHSKEKQPATKIYLCHTCGEFFSRASHLKRHTLRKHVPNPEKKYECPICRKKFLEKSDVTGHVKLHDGLKPFECDQCSKCFRTSWRLQAHIKRVHLGIRPFECPTCTVRFKTKSHLEKHIRTHTGEKPFPCPYCAYKCAEKSNLKKHINIHLKSG